MIFYLVIISDRHCDDNYALYQDIEKAFLRAGQETEKIAEHYGEKPQMTVPTTWGKARGFLFHASLEDAGGVDIKAIETEDEEGGK